MCVGKKQLESDETKFKKEREALVKELSDILASQQEAEKKDNTMKKQILRKIEELKNFSIKESTFLDQSEDTRN